MRGRPGTAIDVLWASARSRHRGKAERRGKTGQRGRQVMKVVGFIVRPWPRYVLMAAAALIGGWSSPACDLHDSRLERPAAERPSRGVLAHPPPAHVPWMQPSGVCA